jgi:cold shock CspA family protein
VVGRICDIVESKGFFFIRTDANPAENNGKNFKDYFAHRSALRGTSFESLRIDMPVEFVEDPHSLRGPRAEEVRIVPEL